VLFLDGSVLPHQRRGLFIHQATCARIISAARVYSLPRKMLS
jgi:hypothetical protein